MNSKWLPIALIVLLALNIASLAALWVGRKAHMHTFPPPTPFEKKDKSPHTSREHLKHALFFPKKLNWNEEQMADLKQLSENHFRALEKHHEGIGELRAALFNNFNRDEAQVEVIADKLAQKQKEFELLTYHHFRAIRSICTEEQKPVYDSLVKEIGQRRHFKPVQRHRKRFNAQKGK